MNSAIPNCYSKKILYNLLFVLRIFIFMVAVTMVVIEIREAYLFKDILHLALFSISFLVCSLQIAISRHKVVMKSQEGLGVFS